MKNNIITPFSKPLYIMNKPAGSLCNLACDYCYYLEKSNLYKKELKQTMSDELLEKFVKEYIQSQTTAEVMFSWHGGETLMRPVSFYQRAIEFQRMYAGGRRIDNCIQTNGILLDDKWCKFFKQNNWLVGISIDGPKEFHDEYRKNKMGAPSFIKVIKGIELLKKHGVEWNAMAVINDYNADYPVEFYQFFKSIGATFIQFSPIVERTFNHSDGRHLSSPDNPGETGITDFSVSPQQWGDFLCALFDEWIKEDVGKIFIQIFDSALANWAGEQPGVCSMARTCGHNGVMEYNGDVYSCDHYVFPEYKLGNIYTHSLIEMMYGDKQTQFGNDKLNKLPSQCKKCEYLFVCNGDCPKNRFMTTADGEYGLNYLCKGYYKFYKHIAPYMDFMKNELDNHRSPANVMSQFFISK